MCVCEDRRVLVLGTVDDAARWTMLPGVPGVAHTRRAQDNNTRGGDSTQRQEEKSTPEVVTLHNT